MKSKFKLITAFVVALTLSGGVYAYTNTTASITGAAVTTAEADLATCNATEDQPDWDSIEPTPGGTIILRPDADGDLTQFEDLVGAPTHWQAVDDVVADDAATHVGSDQGGNTDLFELTDSGLAAETPIRSVTVYERVRREGSRDDDWQIIIKSGITSAYSPTFVETPDWIDRSYQWTTDPDTGEAWTVAAVDALQAGAYVVTGVDVTQVYVSVDYGDLPRGDIPTGDLFVVTPHPDYSGDLTVKVYLTNTGALAKAYQYLNIELYLDGSVEAGEDPDYQLLTLQNGEARFHLEGEDGVSHTLEVTGGSYGLVSDNTSDWSSGWSLEPEFYCEATQR